jgi:hypothetical protein
MSLSGVKRTWPFAGIRFRGRYWGQSGHALLHCICPLMTQSGHRQTISKCYASYVLCVRAGDGHEAAGIYQPYR